MSWTLSVFLFPLLPIHLSPFLKLEFVLADDASGAAQNSARRPAWVVTTLRAGERLLNTTAGTHQEAFSSIPPCLLQLHFPLY